MDDLFTILILALFILGPLIERVLRGARGGQQQRPPQRRPLPGQRPMPSSRPLPGTYTPPPTRRETAQQQSVDSTDMLPSELWEILTGQQRPTPPPPAPRTPPPRVLTPSQMEAEEDEGETLETRGADVPVADEESAYEELRKKRERSTELARKVEHPPPIIVSLETEPALPSVRHTAFHKKVDQPKPAVVQLKARTAPPAMLRLDFNDRPALQRAILLQEILGKPKALE